VFGISAGAAGSDGTAGSTGSDGTVGAFGAFGTDGAFAMTISPLVDVTGDLKPDG